MNFLVILDIQADTVSPTLQLFCFPALICIGAMQRAVSEVCCEYCVEEMIEAEELMKPFGQTLSCTEGYFSF